MATREKLSKVTALNQVAYSQMDDYQFDQCLTALDQFCESFPALEQIMNEALAEDDYVKFLHALEVILQAQKNIHAIEYFEACKKIKYFFNEMIKGNIADNFEDFDAEKTELLRNLSELSIDVQMALTKEGGPITEGEGEKAPSIPRALRILAVDDTAFFLHMLKKHFAGTQHILTCVNAGKQALRFLEDKAVDLFLLDIDMPEMDGYELAKKIRALGHKQPIIFLTSHAGKTAVIKAIEAGGNDFVVKPCNRDQLLKKIEQY